MDTAVLALSLDASAVLTISRHPVDPAVAVILVTVDGLDVCPIFIPLSALEVFLANAKK